MRDDVGTYILIGQTPVPEPDTIKWAHWMETNADNDARRVALTEIPGGTVSTVFLGLDHRHFGDGPPLVFETMVFADGESADMWRCSTWLEAEEAHRLAVAKWTPKASQSSKP